MEYPDDHDDVCRWADETSDSSHDSDDYSSDEADFGDYSHASDLLAMINKQRETGEYTDVVVKVGGVEFPCHRAVLACSLYFKTMLSCKLAESSSNVVQLHEIDSIIFSKILNFLYTGEIRISKDDVQDILEAAHMLQIDNIVSCCLEFIERHLYPSNCLGVMRLANKYSFSDLKKECREVAVSHFLEAVHNDEEMALALSTEELLDLLRDKDLQIANEDDVVNLLIRWLDHNVEDRKTSIPTIIQEIRLSYVRVSVLEKLESHPAVRESSECLAKITAAKEKHLARREDAFSDADMNEHRTRSGISDELAIIVGGWKAAKRWYYNENIVPLISIQSMISLDPDRQQCYHVTDLPTTVSGYTCVTSTGRYLYVTGGRAHPLVGQGPHSAPSRQAFRYDFVTDTWTQLPDMPRGRAGHQSVIADEKLFLIGGDIEQGEGKSLLDTDCYDLEQNVWINLPKMPSVDESWNFSVTSCSHGNDQYPSWTFTVKALQGKVVVIEVLSGDVSHSAKDEEDEDDEDEQEEYSFIEVPRVHVFDVKTACWTSAASDADTRLPDGLEHADENIDIFSIAVGDRLYFRVRSGDSRHNMQTNLYAYDVIENVLITDMVNEEVFTDNVFLTDCSSCYGQVVRQKDFMDKMIMINRYEDNYDREFVRIRTDLPFLLVGYSYFGTKKTSVGWYCRDLVKLGNEDV